MVQIKVTAFKESGKYAHESVTELPQEFVDMNPWDLTGLIQGNDESVKSLSCISRGFVDYYFLVEILESPEYVWPLEEGQSNPQSKFLYFHLDRFNNQPSIPKPYVKLSNPR